ncbi:MAG: purine-nucleoside phosphorylase [Bdellovibrionales bacterium]|nr:purine-nucleoside phosphorylase [Bdellovibrionales bacterium]
MSFLEDKYKEIGTSPPEIHFVLGSGFSAAVDKAKDSSIWEERLTLPFKEVPGLKIPTVESHSGLYRYFSHKPTGRVICFQCGRLHGYEGHSPKEVVQTVILPLQAGTKRFVLTNLAGGLKESLTVGSVVALTDHVNFTGQNPLVGPNPSDERGQPLGPRFPDMSDLYEEAMRRQVVRELLAEGLRVEEGIYIGVLGPNFETAAEVQLFARWGLSAVGMSTVWEALALRHAGVQLSAFSLISNPACGIEAGEKLDHESILEAVSFYSEKIIRSFFNYCDRQFF